MRLACASFAAAALLTAPHAPASAATYVVWQGIATVTAATPACSAAASERTRIAVGTNLRTMLRPKQLADNGADTRLSFIHDGQASFAVFLPGGAATGTYAGFGANYNGMIVANQAVAYRQVATAPKKPTADTVFLTASGTIENFMFIANCTVSYTAAYGLRL